MWKVCLFAVSGAIYRGIHHVTEWWWCFVSQGHQSNLAEFETKLHVDSLTKQACRFDYKHIIQHKGNVPRSRPWWLIHRNLHPFWFFARDGDNGDGGELTKKQRRVCWYGTVQNFPALLWPDQTESCEFIAVYPCLSRISSLEKKLEATPPDNTMPLTG